MSDKDCLYSFTFVEILIVESDDFWSLKTLKLKHYIK